MDSQRIHRVIKPRMEQAAAGGELNILVKAASDTGRATALTNMRLPTEKSQELLTGLMGELQANPPVASGAGAQEPTGGQGPSTQGTVGGGGRGREQQPTPPQPALEPASRSTVACQPLSHSSVTHHIRNNSLQSLREKLLKLTLLETYGYRSRRVALPQQGSALCSLLQAAAAAKDASVPVNRGDPSMTILSGDLLACCAV